MAVRCFYLVMGLVFPWVVFAETGTLKDIYNQKLIIRDEAVVGDKDQKALESYEAFLELNPQAKQSPEALRRLADLRLRGYLKEMEGDIGRDDIAENIRGQREVISLYASILEKYPSYNRNDDVMYQMARSYESIGEPLQAAKIFQSLTQRFPGTEHFDEAQFRIGEIRFIQDKYVQAYEAYDQVVKYGESSPLYRQSLYKAGWSRFKLGQYKKSLSTLLTLMDVVTRRDLSGRSTLAADDNSLQDTLHIIALNFYYLGGVDSITDYLSSHGGPRFYEDQIYARLADLYIDKNYLVEAAKVYKSFLKRNRYHQDAVYIQLKVIELYDRAGATDKILSEKAILAEQYDLDSPFWKFHEPEDLPEVVGFARKTIKELAEHYHGTWQETRHESDYREAEKWYSDYLDSFYEGADVYALSFQKSELLYEKGKYYEAFKQYEYTAYEYEPHPQSAEAGYASLQAYEQYIEQQNDTRKESMKLASVGTYLRFAYAFPQYPKTPDVVMTSAQRVYEAEDYEQAAEVAQMYIENYPNENLDKQRTVWSILALSGYYSEQFELAEQAFHEVLQLTDPSDKRYQEALDQLAATIYKRGEFAEKEGEFERAAGHYRRVREKAPFSDLAINGDYDAATLYVKLEQFDQSIALLEGLRIKNPENPFAPQIVRKLAALYEKSNLYELAATEYLMIGRTDENQDTQREAILKSAELYEKSGDKIQSIKVYREFVERFPRPVEGVIEVMNDIANVYKNDNNNKEYFTMLRKIIQADSNAGEERSARTQFLAASSAVSLATPERVAFESMELSWPIQRSLARKQAKFQTAIKAYERANDYNVAEVTAEATYQVASMYYNFSQAVTNAEKPSGLSELESEQFDILLEEQAYPLEEQAIAVYEANMARLYEQKIYNKWIKSTISALSELLPFRYAKKEQGLTVFTLALPIAEAEDKEAKVQ